MSLYLLIGILVISLGVKNNEIAFDNDTQSLLGDLFWKILGWPFWVFFRERK